jgi:hypothetical protein
MAVAAGPCQDSPASPEVTVVNEDAADDNSPASPCQAVAASNMGADPAPANIRNELISGGNTRKLIALTLSFFGQVKRPYREMRDTIRVSVITRAEAAAQPVERRGLPEELPRGVRRGYPQRLRS